MTMDPLSQITIEVPTTINYPPPDVGMGADKSELPPSGAKGAASVGYRRQKSSSSKESTEESLRRRRLTMPLAYLMYESQSDDYRGTVYGPDEDDFHPEDASKALRLALAAGIQSNDKVIIEVLLEHNNYQRQKIASAYDGMYSRSLQDDLEEEIGGYYFDAVSALIQPAQVYSARLLYHAISGRSHSRAISVEVGLTSTASQLKVVRDAYQSEYRVTLERDLALKIEGLFGRMLHQVLMRRDEFDDTVDVVKAEADVKEIVAEGSGGVEEIGRNLELFSRLFGLQGLNQIRTFVERYDAHQQALHGGGENKLHEVRGKDFETTIRKCVNMHSDTRQMILLFVRISRNMQLYFAERLHEAISGARPDHATIIRILVSRSEIDLHDICHEYKRKYGRHIVLDLQSTCSGEFLRLLTRLVRPPDSNNETDDAFA